MVHECRHRLSFVSESQERSDDPASKMAPHQTTRGGRLAAMRPGMALVGVLAVCLPVPPALAPLAAVAWSQVPAQKPLDVIYVPTPTEIVRQMLIRQLATQATMTAISNVVWRSMVQLSAF